eukprot:NODE_1697_length_765_cov_85.496865_g1648_i0.p1 GENE.NODE_1697_length_765_cov_85.496865_g1648_i0~~NODE_1697_length_765_cov_85.496865_g1648_i0.p1  ORF type:complete len:250 (-),score=40.91 NODE_1697_length_765_cov_85.496865_g1648_i0:16-681(-)
MLQGFTLNFIMYVITVFIVRQAIQSNMRRDPDTKKFKGPSLFVCLMVVVITVGSLSISNYVPLLGEPASVKPYSTFDNFYTSLYVNEHQVPEDRAFHVVLFVSVTLVMLMNRGMFVTWLGTLAFGSFLTRLVLHSSIEWLEATAMTIVSAYLAASYEVPIAYFVANAFWVMGDWGSHVFLGHNGHAALYIGQHYLSWALLAQGKLVTGIIYTYFSEMLGLQ